MENTNKLMYKKKMVSTIQSIAVLGSGTMGAGIAALCLEKGYKVLLLDISEEAVNKAKSIMLNEKYKMLSDINMIERLETGTFEKDFKNISEYDWICEAVVEKVEIKRSIFKKIEEHRKDGSIVSSNTSGIPLRDIVENMPDRMLKDVCITHFFNPVKVMKLCELVPSIKTDQNVLMNLRMFLENVLEKGVVDAKDTVNFIGNRIGCFWMLKGIHEKGKDIYKNLLIEEIDAVISKPIGIPPTGIFGLIDLIGLDVMYSVGKNLAANLPDDDMGKEYVNLPPNEQLMYENKQLGRKTGGGYYRMIMNESRKIKEVFDVDKKEWRNIRIIEQNYSIDVIFENSTIGKYIWNVMGDTLLYSCKLVPEISNNILNIDRAMKWGFGWKKGPFEILDEIGPMKFLDKCKERDIKIPKLLDIIQKSENKLFYKNGTYLDLSGKYEKI